MAPRAEVLEEIAVMNAEISILGCEYDDYMPPSSHEERMSRLLAGRG